MTLLNLALITGHIGVAKVITEHIMRNNITKINQLSKIQHKL